MDSGFRRNDGACSWYEIPAFAGTTGLLLMLSPPILAFPRRGGRDYPRSAKALGYGEDLVGEVFHYLDAGVDALYPEVVG